MPPILIKRKYCVKLTHSLIVMVERGAGGGEREGDFLMTVTVLSLASEELTRPFSLSVPTCLPPEPVLQCKVSIFFSLFVAII